MKPIVLAITLSLACSGFIYAEENYIAPQPNKIMFHVDKLPLDAGMRQKLSTNLTTLAKRTHDGSAAEHRLTAQLLMLAMRLDRDNKSASELSYNLAQGDVLPVSDVKARLKALEWLRVVVEVLGRTDRLSEARVLEVYLKDVLIALDMNSPLAAVHKENANRWDGILPAYVRKRPRAKIPEDIPEPHVSSDISILPLSGGKVLDEKSLNDLEIENPKPSNFIKWTNRSTAISLPLVLVEKDEFKSIYRTEMVEMRTLISPRVKLESELSLELKPWIKPEYVSEFKHRLEPFMKQYFGKYESLKIEVTTDGHLSTRNKENIILPLCLQLIASQKDIQIRDGMSVLGKLSGNKITRGSDFWHLLKILRSSDRSNQRLLIPYTAEPDMKQLVALEEEDFFVKNEVLLVSSIEEAEDLLAMSKKAEINEASQEFAKIQQMIGSKSVGPFAVNKKVRAVLESILIKNPNHLSAKLILLRGDVSRSRKLDTYFVADELSTLLEQTAYLTDKKAFEINGHSLNEVVNKIDAVIEELEPFIAANDRSLVTYITDIAGYLEEFSRAKEKRDSIAIQRTMTNALNNFKLKYQQAKTHLDEIMSKPPTS